MEADEPSLHPPDNAAIAVRYCGVHGLELYIIIKCMKADESWLHPPHNAAIAVRYCGIHGLKL